MSKTALITGASSGIGKSTARALNNNGYSVYGAARRIERMEELEDEGIHVLKMDVSQEESMESGIRQILDTEGSVDVLINNAGYGEYGPIEEVALEDARYQLEVNLFGAARLIQLLLPGMREKGRGKIVNITSIGGKMAQPYGGWYHASKFSMEGLSDSLRNEVRPFGIDVIVIEPGAIKTEWAGIAADHILDYANPDSPYHEAIKSNGERLKGMVANASSPQIIADLIGDVLETDQPKARYHAGAFSDKILSARARMTDEEFDEMISQ